MNAQAISYCYGSTSLKENTEYITKQIEYLGYAVLSKLNNDLQQFKDEYRFGDSNMTDKMKQIIAPSENRCMNNPVYANGCIIDCFTPETSYEPLVTAIKAFDATAIIVIDSEKIYKELEKRFKGISILKLPKLNGSDNTLITSPY